jgi:hypothetical protein
MHAFPGIPEIGAGPTWRGRAYYSRVIAPGSLVLAAIRHHILVSIFGQIGNFCAWKLPGTFQCALEIVI